MRIFCTWVQVAPLAMVRMVPQWFPRHLERRHHSGLLPQRGRLGIALRSATPAASARWFADVFHLECTGDIPETEGDPDHAWVEFRVGTGMIVLWGGGGSVGTDTPLVYVDDLDAHHQHVQTAGAVIVTPVVEHGYRAYTAQDCEGRHWQFLQAGPRIGR